MAAVNAYYARGHGDTPLTLRSEDDIDALIEQVRATSPASAPILIELHLADDPYTQGLGVGVATDRGVLRYSGREWPEGVYSRGPTRSPGEVVRYFYMDVETEFPPDA